MKKNFEKCTSVSVSLEIPAGFDVSTGKISTETVVAVLPATAPIGTGEQEGRLLCNLGRSTQKHSICQTKLCQR